VARHPASDDDLGSIPTLLTVIFPHKKTAVFEEEEEEELCLSQNNDWSSSPGCPLSQNLS
jgi:hypothetical protein